MKELEPPTIMLVDDDSDLLALMKISLEKNGYHVDARTTAPSNSEIAAVDPAVIFMDINLANENGAALCHAIKHSGASGASQVVLISGQADELLHQEAASGLADGCLSKPFSMQHLRNMADYYASTTAH